MLEMNTSKVMNMFARENGGVSTFQVLVDEDLLKSVQSEIDTWSGMGELQYAISWKRPEPQFENEKIRVCSYIPYPAAENDCPFMSFYYEFYQYVPCKLSKLCDDLMQDCVDMKSLDFSEHMALLFRWSSTDEKEMEFVNKLISAFVFERVAEEKREVSRKIGFLEKIKGIIIGEVIDGSQTYDEVVSQRIRSMEVDISREHRKDLRGRSFKFDANEVRGEKRKILS